MFRSTSFLFLGAALVAGLAQGQLQFTTVTRNVVEQRLKQYSGPDGDREERLKRMFRESGCAQSGLSEEAVNSHLPPNLICVVPGQSDEVILIGAHYDHAAEGDGVIDNWSGASLLPSFVVTLAGAPRRHTFVLIAFTGEEKGMLGSEFYVKHLSAEQRAKIKGMINLDTLGLGPTEVWATHSDTQLSSVLNGVAHALNLPLQAMNVDRVGTSDSESFAPYHIPRMTVHSLTQQTLPLLHSPKDKITAVHFDDYYASYRLLSAYLVYLDGYLGHKSAETETDASPRITK
jgi:hypothetical protein